MIAKYLFLLSRVHENLNHVYYNGCFAATAPGVLQEAARRAPASAPPAATHWQTQQRGSVVKFSVFHTALLSSIYF